MIGRFRRRPKLTNTVETEVRGEFQQTKDFAEKQGRKTHDESPGKPPSFDAGGSSHRLERAVGDRGILTIQNASTTTHGLTVGLIWWLIGMGLGAIYFFLTYGLFRGKVRVD